MNWGNPATILRLDVDATSHESLQISQFPNDAVWPLMQNLMLSILL